MAVNTLSHFDIVMRLLSVMEERGRIVFLSSDNHWPGKGGFEVYPPMIPEDLDELDAPGEEAERGLLRYGLSKLVGVMLVYELNRRLQRDPRLSNIRALAVDPGGLMDSRAFSRTDLPLLWKIIVGAGYWLQPLAKRFNPRINSTSGAARDVVDMALADEFAGKEGHFVLREQQDSSPDSRDENMQGKLWDKSIEWCAIKQEDTVLPL
ncbi:hypothetical protein N0V90_007893 [Kalmusia sp. IMI 367209]|nr:hypothetical protein N0V90_007893 [Kalmusia sp. IMI 367209]